MSTVLASTAYQVDARSQPGRLIAAPSTYWPVTLTDTFNAVTILYTSGYGATGSSVPRALRQAMLLLIGQWHEHREEVVIDSRLSLIEMPVAAKALCSPFRTMTAR